MNTRAMIGRYVIIFDTSFSLAVAHGLRWRGGGFNTQTGPILVYSYPLIYINLHVKYENNLI